MIVGSCMRLLSSYTSIWLWFFGHIVCACSQAFLRNPVSKLASNWFGDKERGFATAIGLVSTPLGILIILTLILIIFRSDDSIAADEGGPSNEDTKGRFDLFMTIHSIMSIGMAVPALFFIREKPPSPPSMVAIKSRPV